MEFSLGAWLARIWKDNPKDKKHTLYIGIDGGSQGGIGFLYGDHHVAVDIPVYKVKKGGKNQTVFDLDRIVDIFGGVTGYQGNIKAAVEVMLPHKAAYQARAKTAWNGYRVGMAWYMWPLFLKSKGYKVYEVHPITWKTRSKLKGKSKWRAMKKARKMFPDAELHLAKHEGRCEALLIADYIRQLSEEGDDTKARPDTDDVTVQGRAGRKDTRRGRDQKAGRVQHRGRA